MDVNSESKDGIKFQVRESGTALVCGVLAVGIALFTAAMRLIYPSARGGGAFLYLPLALMLVGGAVCFLLYFNRRLIVEEMDICYVNFIRQEKKFTLDEIGFCKMGVGGNAGKLVLYDLRGDKLCKLDFEMRGMAEFYQYLTDNGVESECAGTGRESASDLTRMLRAIGRESAVCEEEIRKCSALFYEEVEKILRRWERRNKQFEAQWEFGFAEYTARELERRCRMRERLGMETEDMDRLPESYECVLEAYLKREEGYVVDSRGGEVVIALPYLSKTRSYRIGEGTRIRKADEQILQDWLEEQLETLTTELPRRRFHTETFALGHKLRTEAGLRV